MRALIPAVVLAAMSTPAWADEPAHDARARTSSLSWVRLTGAETCVATQELARRVEARLGRPVFVSAAQADVSVEGHVERHGRGFHVEVTLRDARGTTLGVRELTRDTATCDSLAEPLALIIAVMIDPDAALAKPEPPVLTAPPPAPLTPVPAAPLIIEKPVYVVTPPKPTWRLDAGGSLASNLGLLPFPAFGLTAGALVAPPELFPFAAFGTVWLDTTRGTSGSSVTVSLLEGGAGLCPLHYEGFRFHAYGCVRGELGLWTASYGGGALGEHDLYLGGSLEGRISVRLVGPFSARVGMDGAVPVFRPTFRGLFRPAVATASADLGVGLLFP